MKGRVVNSTSLGTCIEQLAGKRYSDGTLEAYIRFAREFELLVGLPETNGYRLSELGIDVIDLYEEGMNNTRFKETLARVLLSSPRRGHIFKRFLDYAREAPSEKMVRKEFNRPTGIVLIQWSLAAGLIREHEGYVATASWPKDRDPSDSEFWSVLAETFAQMRSRSSSGMKRLYAKISEIRPKVTVKLGFNNTSKFDMRLERLLSDNRYRNRISLYGAPTSELEDDRNVFVHQKDGKRYAYLSIRSNAT